MKPEKLWEDLLLDKFWQLALGHLHGKLVVLWTGDSPEQNIYESPSWNWTMALQVKQVNVEESPLECNCLAMVILARLWFLASFCFQDTDPTSRSNHTRSRSAKDVVQLVTRPRWSPVAIACCLHTVPEPSPSMTPTIIHLWNGEKRTTTIFIHFHPFSQYFPTFSQYIHQYFAGMAKLCQFEFARGYWKSDTGGSASIGQLTRAGCTTSLVMFSGTNS